MRLHAYAKLGSAGRVALVEAVDGGLMLMAAAAAFEVSLATAYRWWRRFSVASVQQRQWGKWAGDRSSRPLQSPRRLSAAEVEPILRARRETNLGPGRLSGIVRGARSTVWKVLRRDGLWRRRRAP